MASIRKSSKQPNRASVYRDALYNLHPSILRSPDSQVYEGYRKYCQGIVNGVMCGLMVERNIFWNEAVEAIVQYLPDEVNEDGIPDPWRNDIVAAYRWYRSQIQNTTE